MGLGTLREAKDPVQASWGYLSSAHNGLRQALAVLERHKSSAKHPARRKLVKLITEAEKAMELYGDVND